MSKKLLGFLDISKFIGEETSYENDKVSTLLNEPFIWIIDPIDGTKNYVNGNDNFCSMISIASYGLPIATFIYQPLKKEMIYAFKGHGTYLTNIENNITHQISIPIVDNNNIIGSGGTKGIPKKYRNDVMNNLKSQTKRLFIGSAGIETLMLAKNQLQFIFHGRVTPWDHSPLDLIIREAGGFVYMARDKKLFNIRSAGPILAASNMNLWNEIRDIAIPITCPYRLY